MSSTRSSKFTRLTSQEGASWLFADAWEDYEKQIPEEERGDMIAAYYRRLTGDDPVVRDACALAWSRWEMATSKLKVCLPLSLPSIAPGFIPSHPQCFLI